MKKTILLLTLSTLLICTAKSQDTIYLSQKRSIRQSKTKEVFTDRPPQAIYAELYGRGIIYSINYDRRFQNKLTGLGFSAGFGGLAVDGTTFITVPLSINHLAGSRGHYFEMGAGITFASGSTIDFNDAASSGSAVFGTLTLGYRSQPINGGLNFRAGLNFIAGNSIFLPYPYISLGFNF